MPILVGSLPCVDSTRQRRVKPRVDGPAGYQQDATGQWRSEVQAVDVDGGFHAQFGKLLPKPVGGAFSPLVTAKNEKVAPGSRFDDAVRICDPDRDISSVHDLVATSQLSCVVR
jgi:hypothetical protein